MVSTALSQLRFYAGHAGKVTGQTVESNENKFTYTRREPYGVVGQIVPWNGPLVSYLSLFKRREETLTIVA